MQVNKEMNVDTMSVLVYQQFIYINNLRLESLKYLKILTNSPQLMNEKYPLFYTYWEIVLSMLVKFIHSSMNIQQ